MRRQRLVYLRWKIWAIEVRLLDAFKGSQSIMTTWCEYSRRTVPQWERHSHQSFIVVLCVMIANVDTERSLLETVYQCLCLKLI